MAAWMIMVGSVVVVALVYDRIAGLHSIETRDAVESFLAQPPGADLGLDVDGVLTIIRTLSMIAAGCATAAAILGFHVLRRSRSARLGLTILAVPLFLTGMVTGGFVAAVIAASAAMLWLQPARSWFSGEPVPARSGQGRSDGGRSDGGRSAAGSPPVGRHSARLPGPVSGGPVSGGPVSGGPVSGGRPAEHPYGEQPAPTSHPWPAADPSRSTARSAYPIPQQRPTAVTGACLITWALCGLGIVAMTLSALVFAGDADYLLDQARRQQPELTEQGVTDEMLLGATFAMIGVAVLWCLAAIVVAVFAFRGHEWARLTLVVSASVVVVGSLTGAAMGAVLLFIPLVGAAVSIGLLARPDSRLWFARRRHTP